jgi:hypothetical protein
MRQRPRIPKSEGTTSNPAESFSPPPFGVEEMVGRKNQQNLFAGNILKLRFKQWRSVGVVLGMWYYTSNLSNLKLPA